MEHSRSRLGKGLSALIPSEPIASAAAAVDSALRELPISAIVPNRYQPRRHFDEVDLDSLTASIRELGVLQPILVRPSEGGSADGNTGAAAATFELIAGERRWRAAKRAGLQTIPALVREVADTTSLEHALVENLHRADLNALEEAAAYQQLIEDFGLTHDQVAQRVGKSRSAVSNTLRLFQLPPSVQKLVSESQLSAGHARALLGSPDRTFQEALARRTVSEGLSVREVEDAVRVHNDGIDGPGANGDQPDPEPTHADEPTGDAANRRLRPPGLLELEQLLSEHLDTRVTVTMGQSRGKVQIEFADLEDLERIYRRMAS